jgi:hypothetical protein
MAKRANTTVPSKSKAIKRMAKKHGVKVVDVKLGRYKKVDLRGIPTPEQAKGVLFMDELNPVPPEVQAGINKAAYDMLDKQGHKRLAKALAGKSIWGVPGIGKSATIVPTAAQEAQQAREVLKGLRKPGRQSAATKEALKLIEQLLSDYEHVDDDELPAPKRSVWCDHRDIVSDAGGSIIAHILDDVPQWVLDTLDAAPASDLSEWRLVRLANGDLLFGRFPQGDTYEEITQGLNGRI